MTRCSAAAVGPRASGSAFASGGATSPQGGRRWRSWCSGPLRPRGAEHYRGDGGGRGPLGRRQRTRTRRRSQRAALSRGEPGRTRTNPAAPTVTGGRIAPGGASTGEGQSAPAGGHGGVSSPTLRGSWGHCGPGETICINPLTDVEGVIHSWHEHRTPVRRVSPS